MDNGLGREREKQSLGARLKIASRRAIDVSVWQSGGRLVSAHSEKDTGPFEVALRDVSDQSVIEQWAQKQYAPHVRVLVLLGP